MGESKEDDYVKYSFTMWLYLAHPRAKTPVSETINFTIYVGDFMDIITINLVFNKYIHVHMYDNRERDFLRFNRVLLHVYGKIGPNLESEPFIQEP